MLKMISSARAAHSREFVDVFCFYSCKTSKDVTFRNWMQRFMATSIRDAKLYALFFLTSLDEVNS